MRFASYAVTIAVHLGSVAWFTHIERRDPGFAGIVAARIIRTGHGVVSADNPGVCSDLTSRCCEPGYVATLETRAC